MPELLKGKALSEVPNNTEEVGMVTNPERLVELINKYGVVVIKFVIQEKEYLWKLDKRKADQDKIEEFAKWLFGEPMQLKASPGGTWRKEATVYRYKS